MWRRLLFWMLLLACVVVAARLTEQHAWQLDITEQQRHSLSDVAQQAMDQLGPGMELIAFIPDFPISRGELENQLAPYLAHPSRPALRYVDPLEQPDRAESLGMQRQGEIHLRYEGRQERLRDFSTGAFDRALNRLALRGDRWIVLFGGAGMPVIDDSPLGLGTLAERAELLGYRMLSIDLRRIDQLPDNTAVLLVIGPEEPLGEATTAIIERYLARGGRVLWLGGDAAQPWLASTLGIRHDAGLVVDADAARFGIDSPANAIIEAWPEAVIPFAPEAPGVLYRATPLQHAAIDGWTDVGKLLSSPRSWNETGPLTGRLRRDATLGEKPGPLTVGLALENETTPPQRVFYLGSTHAFSNAQIGRFGNTELALGALRWLTDNTSLATEVGTPSHDVHWSPRTGGLIGIFLMGVLPALYLGAGLWRRARRRRR